MKPPIKKPLLVEPLFCECGDHAWAYLSRGYTTLVSPEDAELLRHKWHAHHTGAGFYAFRTIHVVGSGRETAIRRSEYLHRRVCDADIVDHKNRQTLDNRRPNLRPATAAMNVANRSGNRAAKSSKYKGVTWDAGRGKWLAQLGVGRKHKFLGRFDSEEAAARAYDLRATQEFGEFALVNFRLCEGAVGCAADVTNGGQDAE